MTILNNLAEIKPLTITQLSTKEIEIIDGGVFPFILQLMKKIPSKAPAIITSVGVGAYTIGIPAFCGLHYSEKNRH
jgi:hypothetical protein